MPVDHGDPIGMYHLIVGEGQNAFVANGLGGTSLVNANVFLRTDPGTLGLKIWPEKLRGKALDKCKLLALVWNSSADMTDRLRTCRVSTTTKPIPAAIPRIKQA